MGLNKFLKKMLFSRKLDFQEGKLEILGVRGIMLPTFTFSHLLEEIYRNSGDQLFDFLFETGKNHAEEAIEAIFSKYKVPKREFPSQALDSGNIMGLGKLEVDYFMPDKKKLKLTIKNSPFVEEFKQSDVLKDLERPVDDLQRGFIHAYAEKLFDCEVESKEEKCEFLGHEKCVIKVQAKEN